MSQGTQVPKIKIKKNPQSATFLKFRCRTKKKSLRNIHEISPRNYYHKNYFYVKNNFSNYTKMKFWVKIFA